jgi:hypothetical protein
VAKEDPVAMWLAAMAGGMVKVTKGAVPLRRVEGILCIEMAVRFGFGSVIGNLRCRQSASTVQQDVIGLSNEPENLNRPKRAVSLSWSGKVEHT